MANEEAQTTLRDEISANFDKFTAEEPAAVETPTAPAQEAVEAAPAETAEQRAGRTANRLRDEQGRLLPGKKEPQAAAAPVTAVANPSAEPAAVQRPARPSSWKKDFDEHWNTLDPKLAEYIHQRESEYARGVSTYKHEADQARHLNEAIAPFIPNLQRHNIEPTQWIRNLGAAHERLALGSPQERANMGAQLIRDYGIDLNLLSQVLQQPAPVQQQRPAPQPQSVDYEKIIEQKLEEKEARAELNRFIADVPTKYKHYEAVKETMFGLLQSGLAKDYTGAYEISLRLPQHASLYEQEQQQRLQAEEAGRAAKNQAVVNRARANASSVKSSTPAGNMAQMQGPKSLRDELAANLDAVMGSGRV